MKLFASVALLSEEPEMRTQKNRDFTFRNSAAHPIPVREVKPFEDDVE